MIVKIFRNSGSAVNSTSILPAKEIFVLSESIPASVTQSQVNSVTKQIPTTFNRIAILCVSMSLSDKSACTPERRSGIFFRILSMITVPEASDNNKALCGLCCLSITASTAVMIAAPQITIISILQPKGAFDG